MTAMPSSFAVKKAPNRLVSTSAATLGCLALAGVAMSAVGLSSTDRMIESSFTVAMAGQSPSTAIVAPAARNGVAMVSGSEDFWLGRLPNAASPVAWSSPLSAGDRFAMGAEGAERHLAVVSVHETSVSVGGRGKPVRLLLVECRDLDQAASAPLVRLIVDDALAASLKAGATPARTL